MENSQELARLIAHKTCSIMKFTLELEEMSYREHGRNDSRYKTFKRMLMATTYETLRELFEELVEWKLIKKTDYPEDVKDGYRDTASGGSGYLNSKRFGDFLAKMAEGNKVKRVSDTE
jgi:DNA-binding HxlR family transcriptional regulator